LRGRKSARRLEKFARLAENRSRLLAKHIEREYATWGRVVNETRIIANWQARGSWRLRSARCIRDSPARVLAFCYLKPQFFPTKERGMRGTAVIFVLSAGIITSAGAQELTWRKDIQPIIAARALGLDCGPMSGFDNAKVDAAFFPDGRWKSNFLINLGKADPAKVFPRNPRLSFDEACKVL